MPESDFYYNQWVKALQTYLKLERPPNNIKIFYKTIEHFGIDYKKEDIIKEIVKINKK